MNVILYRRVSTQKQGISGLGLEAQDTLIQNYLKANPEANVVAAFEEVETGTNKRKRPMLKAALQQCQLYNATLIVATLSRLSRNVHFISGLMESKVKFIALDCPNMDKTMTYFLSVMAEWEADVISKRVKDALKASKARGTELGSMGKYNLTEDARRKGLQESIRSTKAKSKLFAQRLEPIILDCQRSGMNLSQIAERLSALQVKTYRGSTKWYPSGVANILKTLGKAGSL